MMRVLMVILSYRLLAVIPVVMLFAVSVALVLLQWSPVPIIEVMGGLRLSDAEWLQRALAANVLFLGICSWPFWLMTVIAAAIQSTPRWSADVEPARLKGVLGGLALASVVGWALVLPFTQPEQIRRYRIDRAFAEGRVAEALDEMSWHERSDYPPLWRLPPPRGAWAGPGSGAHAAGAGSHGPPAAC